MTPAHRLLTALPMLVLTVAAACAVAAAAPASRRDAGPAASEPAVASAAPVSEAADREVARLRAQLVAEAKRERSPVTLSR